MTREQMAKKLFVTGPLTTLLIAATDGYVRLLEYTASRDDETVRVTFSNNSHIDVNVSCDSKWALAHDVIDAVAKRF